jgi:RNA-directed DNA polymerase
VHLSQGFDFLGFNIRRYSSRKLLVKPSKAAVKRLRARLAAEVRALRGLNALAVVTKLNPIIKGWAAYYRSAVSGRVFASLDNYLWQLLYKWSTWSHHDKPKRWIVDRYFGKRNKFRNDHWVFGAPGTGAYVVKFAWTDIVWHTMVKGGASPDDPELAEYWANRRRRVQPPLDGYTVGLLARQDARCPLCGDPLLLADQPPESPDQWERWWLQLARKAISADYLVHHAHHGRPGARPDNDHTRLVHASCKRGHLARRRRASTSSQPLSRPCGLLEPYAVMSGSYGSEGRAAQQCAALTRPSLRLRMMRLLRTADRWPSNRRRSSGPAHRALRRTGCA